MARLLAGRLVVAIAVLTGGVLAAPTAWADTIDTQSREDVATAYTDRLLPALRTAPEWTGDPALCEPGSPEVQPEAAVGRESEASRQATFAAINYYRAMAGLQPVTENPSYSALARQAALIMLAQEDLSHDPDPDWACYSEQGAIGAGLSNIAISWGGSSGASARAIEMYMDDYGSRNEDVGHRRWLLYPPAAEFGTGSTERSNAVVVIGEDEKADPRPESGVAWPSAGYFPWEILPTSRRWSYALPDADDCAAGIAQQCWDDLDQASVTMTRNGEPLAVDIITRGGHYGDPALVWETEPLTIPRTSDGDAYEVTIAGATTSPISYRVQVFRATPERLSTTPTPKISGTAKVGRTLTAKAGTWKPSGVTLTYQWYRGGSAIAQATSSRYTLQPADRGQRITVQVTGSRSGHVPVTRASKATRKVTTGEVTTARPKIDGRAAVGGTLTARAGAWKPGEVTLKYQWYRNGKRIKGATQAEYTVTKRDQRKKLTVKVTGKAGGYSTASRTSKPTKKVG